MLSEAESWIRRWNAALERTSQADRASHYPHIGLEALVACQHADLARALALALPSGPEAARALVVVARALERTPGRLQEAPHLLVRALESGVMPLYGMLELLECASGSAASVLGHIGRLVEEDRAELRPLDLAVAVARQRAGLDVSEKDAQRALEVVEDATSGGNFDAKGELQTCLSLRWHLARKDAESLDRAGVLAERLLAGYAHFDNQAHRLRAFMDLLAIVRTMPDVPPRLVEAVARTRAEIRRAQPDETIDRLLEAGQVELLELLESVPAPQFRDYAVAIVVSSSNRAEGNARLKAADRLFDRMYDDHDTRERFDVLFADHLAWKARALVALGEPRQALSLLAVIDQWALADGRAGRADCFGQLAGALIDVGASDAAFDALRKAVLEPRSVSETMLPAGIGDLRPVLDGIANADEYERPRVLLEAIENVPPDVDPGVRGRWLDEMESLEGVAKGRRAIALAREGRSNGARSLLSKMEADPSQGPAALHEMAIAYAALGDKASSLATLRRSVAGSPVQKQPFDFAPLEPEELTATRAKLHSALPEERVVFELAANDLLRLSAALAGTSLSQLGRELLSEVEVAAKRRFGTTALTSFEEPLALHALGRALIAHGWLDDAEGLIGGDEYQVDFRHDGMNAADLALARVAQADREGAERALTIRAHGLGAHRRRKSPRTPPCAIPRRRGTA